MIRLAASKAREEFANTLDRVAHRGERVVLHRRGKEVAALVPMADLELIRRIEDKLDNEAADKAEDKADQANDRASDAASDANKAEKENETK